MAKNLLTKKAIRYIVQLRNNEDVYYSYAKIAQMVEENFGVKVCFQTIAYHYKKHKDNPDFQEGTGLENITKIKNDKPSESSPVAKPKIVTKQPDKSAGRELADWEKNVQRIRNMSGEEVLNMFRKKKE